MTTINSLRAALMAKGYSWKFASLYAALRASLTARDANAEASRLCRYHGYRRKGA